MYDVIIVGGGPAGYTAAIYCGRANLKTLLIEKNYAGGQMATTESLENYPGFTEPISGIELAMAIATQAEKFGTEVINENVTEVITEGKIKIIKTAKQEFESKAVILCMGAVPRKLGLKNEQQLMGAGISYCATCDGSFFRDKTVAIIGGGDTALADAIYLSRICKKIYIVHRRDELRGSKYLQKKILKDDKIEVLWDSVPSEIVGETRLEALNIKNVKTDKIKKIDIQGLFVAIGVVPSSELVKGKVELNKNNYVISDREMRTNIPGIFVAGDLREKELRQVITAAADGAIASYIAEQYISDIED